MKYYFSQRQMAHQPQQYMIHGILQRAFENNDRAERLKAALEAAGLERAEPPQAGLDPVHAIHADHFIDYLRTAHAEFTALPNAGAEVLPNVHPYLGAASDFAPRGRPRATGIIGRTGWYVGDLSAVINAGTYESVIASSDAAVAAADAVLGGATGAFALCRPPGHHAYVDRASGFCFVNNAGVAAQRLRALFDKVAIIDFDTHHGDGTQAIFYSRDDVFYGSVHTEPQAYYPHFVGYADERGAGAGEGFNLNIPLAWGGGDETFLDANRALIAAARVAGAQALVLSAGWDAHHLDPLSKQKVTTDGFARLGELYGAQGLPTVIVQEGGYSLQAIGEASEAFMKGWRGAAGA